MQLRDMFNVCDVAGGSQRQGQAEVLLRGTAEQARQLRSGCCVVPVHTRANTAGPAPSHADTACRCVAGDGAVSGEDMEIVLRQLAGSSLSDAELQSVIRKVGGPVGRVLGRVGGRAGRQAGGGALQGTAARPAPGCTRQTGPAPLAWADAVRPRSPASPPGHPPPRAAAAQVMATAGAGERGLTFPEYRAALEGLAVDLHVDVPAED